MSATTMAQAWAPVEAAYKEKVMEHTWGHLAPERGKIYHGTMSFAHGDYGDLVPLHTDFKELPDSPWFFEDMMDFIFEQAKEPGIYDFKGKYVNNRFVGKTARRPDASV